ncbi:MAG: putative N-(5phosphoribosyl)anthranilate isomerase TrpF [Pseudomonadota bacterium]|jgi:phosphoribosylanthranilate isomerase
MSLPCVVKICCISSVEEARLACAAGAGVLGLVSAMPSGPGVIDEALIGHIVARLPAPVQTFLLTSRQDAASIAEQQRRCGTSAVQLVDHVAPEALRQLRTLLPGVALVQVIHVQDDTALDEAVAVAPLVDAILLDSGNQKLAVKELGGTGRTHDWRLSRRIRDAIWPLPLYLAGGLNADNIAEAVATVRPHGVDLCSGVRRDGRLDADRLAAFFAALRRVA